MIQQLTNFSIETEHCIERNIILCSISRYSEFLRLSEELLCLRNYIIKAEPFVSHDRIYVKDSEGFLSVYEVDND